MSKVFRLFVIVAVLAVMYLTPTYADDHYDNLRDHINQVKINLSFATTSSVLQDSIVAPYIRDAYIKLSYVVYGKLVVDTISAVANQIDYSLDTAMIKVQNVMFRNVDTIKALRMVSMSRWSDIYSNPQLLKENEKGFDRKPSFFDWRNGYLYLYPAPVDTGSYVVYGYGRVTDLLAAADSTFPAQLPMVYRPAAIYYATAMVARHLGRYDEAEIWKKEYQEAVSDLNATVNARDYYDPKVGAYGTVNK